MDTNAPYAELLRWAAESGIGGNEVDYEFLDGSTILKWGDMHRSRG